MSVRIDANPPGSLATGFAPGGQTAGSQSGSLGGVPVQVRDELSILTDAAEEIGFALSEKREARAHGERSIRASERPRVLTIAQITEYLDKTRSEEKPQTLAALAKRLLESGANPGQLARNNPRFNSPTEQYLLLQYARQLGTEAGASPSSLARIDDALADLDAWFGKTIAVNLATVDDAAGYGSTVKEVRDFQGSVHAVLGKPSLAQALQEVLKLAGQTGNKLEAALLHLTGALGACLSATSSLAEKALLQTLVTDLYHLKTLRTLMEDCKAMVRSLKKDRDTAPAGSRRRRKSREDDPDDGQNHVGD